MQRIVYGKIPVILMRCLKILSFACAFVLCLATQGRDTYYWVGGEVGNWNDVANWTKSENITIVNADRCPTANDNVHVTNTARIAVNGDSAHSLTIHQAQVTLVGKEEGGFFLDYVTDNDGGVLILDNVAISRSLVVETVALITNSVTIKNPNCVVQFYINVGGDGTLTVADDANKSGYVFNSASALSDFTGTIHGGATNDESRIYGGANAIWELGMKSGGDCVLFAGAGEVQFGSLSSLKDGFSLKGRKNLTLTIGNRSDVVSTLVIPKGLEGTDNTIKKIGTAEDGGEMKLAASVANLVVADGAVTLTDPDNVPESIVFTGGDTELVIDSNGRYGCASDDSWLSIADEQFCDVQIDVEPGKVARFADDFANADGFMKSGDGLLELTAIPAWSGTTAVIDNGYLIVPPESNLNLDTVEFPTSSIVLPDGRQMLYASGNSAIEPEPSSIDPLDQNSTQTVAPTYEQIEASGGDAVEAARKLAGIKIPISVATNCPTLTASDYKGYFNLKVIPKGEGAYDVVVDGLSTENVVSQVEESAIDALQGSGTVLVKPGLYYGFSTGDNPNLVEPKDFTLATGSAMTIEKPSMADRGFVRIVISVKPKD